LTTIPFSKYQGTGNDFILIDNRSATIKLNKNIVSSLCHRRFGIGADGLMLLENEPGFDFKMVYYNSDGAESSMCGNGGRCLVLFAYHSGIHLSEYSFIAIDGPHVATIENNGWIRLQMKDVNKIETHFGYAVVDTGSPHYVKTINNLRDYPVVQEGRHIRHSEKFNEKGINVNFVESLEQDTIFVRTYERGVEDETMSCGTGVTAAALLQAHNDFGFNHINIQTPGGRLYVEYDKQGEEDFRDIWLCGPAVKVFDGTATV
jgi:diaminopimelate epimerase